MTTQAKTGTSVPNSTPFQNKEHALVKFGIDPDKIVLKDGRYWMTAEQLGIALGYSNPRKGVMKVLERHRKELRPFTAVVNLGTPSSKDGRGGGLQECTIFNTDGQYRVAFFANTPKAEKFRTFVVNMLEALERKELIPIRRVEKWRQELIDLKLSFTLHNSRTMDWKKYNKMIRYRKLGLTLRETAKLLDIGKDTVQQFERIPKQYDLKLLQGGA